MPIQLRPLVVVLSLVASGPTAGAQAPAKTRPIGPTVSTTTHRELIPLISPDGETLWLIREGVETETDDKAHAQVEADTKVLEAKLNKVPPEPVARNGDEKSRLPSRPV